MKIKYDDLTKDIFCECGCGRKLSMLQKKKGCRFSSKRCAGKIKSIKSKGVARGTYNVTKPARELEYAADGVSYLGWKVCKNFSNEIIECVICYEKGLYRSKLCRVK